MASPAPSKRINPGLMLLASTLTSMTIITVVTAVFGILGLLATGLGIQRISKDPRRIAAYSYTIIGTGATLLSAGLLLYLLADWPILLAITLGASLLAIGLGTAVGYPLLVGFLLWAGITTLRRESRSLGNMLSLLAGLALFFLPTALAVIEPAELVRDDLAYELQYGTYTAVLLLITYTASCFAAFIIASLAYRWRKPKLPSSAVIILGAGLINGKVPPLLASRLKRGITARHDDAGEPVIITSGGKGDDEPVAEGVAMRDYVIEHGVAPEHVIAEDQSTNTEENLQFSRKLLPDASAPVTVVTSSYHVFRAALLTRQLGLRAHVVGAPTAWYYLPSAIIREFIAVMRDHLKIHLVAALGILVLTIAFTAWVVPAMVIP